MLFFKFTLNFVPQYRLILTNLIIMKRFWLSIIAAKTLIGMQAATTWNLDGTNYTVDTIYHATVGPGITETHLKIKQTSGSNANNLYYTTIDLNNDNLELRGVIGESSTKAQETVISMGNRMNKKNNGQYITGINADFFNMGGNPIYPNGGFVADGKLHNPWTELGWNSYVYVNGKKDISMTENLTVQTGLTFPNGTEYPYHTNSGRYDNYLCLYTPAQGATTGTNVWGAECTMKLVSGSVSAYTAVFEVTGTPVGDLSGNSANGNMAIPSNGYVLSGTGAAYSLVKALKPGDRLSVGPYVTINGSHAAPTQVLGGCPLIVINGEIAPAEAFTRIDHFSSAQARTAIGYNKDKSKLIMLVDDKYSTANSNRPAYGTSAGLTLKRLAYAMKYLGCYNAMNFDGGGSSQLYIKDLGMRNIPYGSTSSFRQVANGFFAVSTTPVDNEIASIATVDRYIKLNTGGSITPTVYGFNKYGVLVNKSVTGFSLEVPSELGTVSGSKFTAGNGKYSTNMRVIYGNATCEVPLYTNGGGTYIENVDPNAVQPTLTEVWKMSDPDLNDGWDGTAPSWDTPDAIKSKPCTRFATGMDGKIYTVNMRTMSIAEVTADGVKDVHKLPSLEGRTVSNIPDYYGTAISRDDAGNFLIGHLFTKPESNLVWTIFNPVTGKYKHFELDIPEGMSVKRLDCIGRVVGDLSRDAYFYIAPNAFAAEQTHETNQKVRIIHVKGNGNIENVTVEDSWSPMIYLSSTLNNNVCQPKYDTAAETAKHQLFTTFYSASNMFSTTSNAPSSQYFSFNDNGSEDWSLAWLNSSAQSTTNGFDTFVLDGKRYFVRNHVDGYKQSIGNTMNIVIFNENGKKVASWINPDYYSGLGYCSITTEKTDDKNANIYVYNSTSAMQGVSGNGGGAAAMLQFSVGEVEKPQITYPAIFEEWKYFSEELNDGWDGTAPDWNTPDTIKGKPCTRFATGMDGKIYTVNMKTMSIAEITPYGMVDRYPLPTLEGVTVNNIPDYYGTAISCDDAGNFLVGHLFTKPQSSLVWTIFSPETGKYQHFELNVPEGMQIGRIDCVGRVLGDLTRDALFYIAPVARLEPVETNQKVRIVHVQGNGSLDNVTVNSYFSPMVYTGATHNQNIAQPKYSSIVEALSAPSLFDTFYMSSCSSNTENGQSYATFNNGSYDWNLNIALKKNIIAATNGFDSFVLEGKRYFVRNYVTDDKYATNSNAMDIAVLDESGDIVALWTNPEYNSTSGYSSITARVIDEKNAYIYVFNSANKINGSTGGGYAARLRFSTGEVEQEEPIEMTDVTPSGLDFDTYQDGEPFIVTPSVVAETAAPWSNRQWTSRDDNPDAFKDNGQLTVVLFRGKTGAECNYAAYVEEHFQPDVAVREVDEYIGKCLVLNQAWAPGCNTKKWEGVQYCSGQTQLSFFLDKDRVYANPADKDIHYIRVRLVYNILKRGCHDYLDDKNNSNDPMIYSIYATCDQNWVVPSNDNDLAADYADYGKDFARWENETRNPQDIPANPVIMDPTGLEDLWDFGHGTTENDPNGGRNYIINTERFRVYEFDAPLDPAHGTISVQVNTRNRNATFLFKEIKFFDLGTDINSAKLLGKRQRSWIYFDKGGTTGVNNISADNDDISDGMCEYYNLQGVRVNNPGSGLYIVKRGNHIYKQVIR